MHSKILIILTTLLPLSLAGCNLPPAPEFEDLIYTAQDKKALIALTFDQKSNADLLIEGKVFFQQFDPDSFQFTNKTIAKRFCDGCSFEGALKSYVSTKGRPFQVGKLEPGYYGVRKILYKELFYPNSIFQRGKYKTIHSCINQNVEIFQVKAGHVNAIDLGHIEDQSTDTADEVQNLFKLVTIETQIKPVSPLALISFVDQECTYQTSFKNQKFELIKIYD